VADVVSGRSHKENHLLRRSRRGEESGRFFRRHVDRFNLRGTDTSGGEEVQSFVFAVVHLKGKGVRGSRRCSRTRLIGSFTIIGQSAYEFGAVIKRGRSDEPRSLPFHTQKRSFDRTAQHPLAGTKEEAATVTAAVRRADQLESNKKGKSRSPRSRSNDTRLTIRSATVQVYLRRRERRGKTKGASEHIPCTCGETQEKRNVSRWL